MLEQDEAENLEETAPPARTIYPSPGDDALRQADLYRSVFQVTTDAMAIVDMTGRIVEANEAACRLHGYLYEELIGLTIDELTHPEYRHTVDPGIEDISRGGAATNTIVGVRSDGTSFHAETHGTMFTFRGQPHILAVARDITDRVQAEDQLRETEEQYRKIFESSSDGLIISDPTTGRVAEANPAVCRMHGYSYEEFIGLHGHAFIHPDYHPVFRDFIETISSGKTYQTQAIDTRKDASTFAVEVHGSPLIYEGKQHILAVVRDISERIRAEQAVLEERQRLSRELHDSVSQALYGIALSTRTARTLLDRDPRSAAEPLDFALVQAQRGLAEMRALIFELRPETLEREGLAAALDKQIAVVRTRHNIEIHASLCDEPAVSIRVKEALYRIAQEALHNTVKHAAATRIELEFRCDDENVTLVIRDNGRGFDTTGSFPGHLGLKSMRERATRLGGKFHLDSSPGLGTVIRTSIPIP